MRKSKKNETNREWKKDFENGKGEYDCKIMKFLWTYIEFLGVFRKYELITCNSE